MRLKHPTAAKYWKKIPDVELGKILVEKGYYQPPSRPTIWDSNRRVNKNPDLYKKAEEAYNAWQQTPPVPWWKFWETEPHPTDALRQRDMFNLWFENQELGQVAHERTVADHQMNTAISNHRRVFYEAATSKGVPIETYILEHQNLAEYRQTERQERLKADLALEYFEKKENLKRKLEDERTRKDVAGRQDPQRVTAESTKKYAGEPIRGPKVKV